MKYFELTFPDTQRKIIVNDDHSFIPYQNYLDFGPLISVKELTEDEFNTSELKDLTPESQISEPKPIIEIEAE